MIRQSRPRYSSPYVYKTIGDTRYQFSGAGFVPKTKTYYVANKAEQGKIDLDPTLRGVEVQKDGTVKQFKL